MNYVFNTWSFGQVFLCLFVCIPNYKPRRGRSRGSRGSPFTWNILGAIRQVFTPLHSNASNRVRVNSISIKTRICTFTGSGWSVYEVHQNRITNPDGDVHEVHEVHHSPGTYWGPLDKYLLHCIRTLRTGFESIRQISNPFKFPLIQYLILLEYGSNPVRNTNVHNPIRQLRFPSNLYETSICLCF